MLVFDDEHLAYWERSKRQALENLGSDRRVAVIYANFKAQRDGLLESGFLRFYGNRRTLRVRPGARGDLSAPHQTRAGTRRRRQGHRRADQGRARSDVRGKPLP